MGGKESILTSKAPGPTTALLSPSFNPILTALMPVDGSLVRETYKRNPRTKSFDDSRLELKGVADQITVAEQTSNLGSA